MDKVFTFTLLFFRSCYLFWDTKPTCLGDLIQQTPQHQHHVLCHCCLTHRPLLMPYFPQLPWLFTLIICHECQSQEPPGRRKHPQIFPSKIAWEFLREPSMHSPGIFSAAPGGMMFCLTCWPPWAILHGFCLWLTLLRSNIWLTKVFSSFFQTGLVKMVGRVPNLSSACFVPPAFTSTGMSLLHHLSSWKLIIPYAWTWIWMLGVLT